MRTTRLAGAAGGREAEPGVHLSFLRTSQVDHLLDGEAGQRPGVSPQGRLPSGRWGMSGLDPTVPKGHVEVADSAQRDQEPGGQGGGGKEQNPAGLGLSLPCQPRGPFSGAVRPVITCFTRLRAGGSQTPTSGVCPGPSVPGVLVKQEPRALPPDGPPWSLPVTWASPLSACFI